MSMSCGSCHRGMAHPQVVDGGDSHNGAVLQVETGHPNYKIPMLLNVKEGHGLGWILWYDLSNGKWTSDLDVGK